MQIWDIDRFPLTVEAAKTPGQIAAEKWLAENGENMRPVEPGMLDRLTEEEHDNPDERYRNFGVPTSGGGHVPERYTPYGQGYNRENRRYIDETGEYGHFPGQEPRDIQHGDYVLHPRPSIDPFGGLFGPDEDSFHDSEPETYHVVTRPTGTLDPHDRTALIEHRVHTMGNRFEYNPNDVWEQFVDEHPEFDSENNSEAEHEIVDVHPESHHDRWHGELAKEEENFSRVSQHGLRRESDDIIGHPTYRYEEPSGVVHRLWHSPHSANGSGWHTSRYDPRYSRESQSVPWTEHPDDASEDSLGDALAQFERNKRLSRG